MTTTYPDASTTGVPQGTNLTQYTGTLHITTDNAVIENLEVNGNIVIDADNVSLKNITLHSDTPWHAIQVMDDATGFTLMDSDIDGGGTTVNGVLGHGTFLRNDIQNVENGLNVTGASEIRDNYIHSLKGGPEAHYDGIEVNGGSNIQILHNTVVNDHGQTSAIMLDNYFSGLSNINVDGNQLVGGGYTVYLDDRFGGGAVDDTSISITNNEIGGGSYGDFALYENAPVISGNVDLGESVTATAGGTIVPQTGQSTATPVTSGPEANTVVTSEAGSGAVSGQESTTTPITSAGTDANAVMTTEAGSGGVSGDASTATSATSTGTDANGVVTVEAGSGAVSGEESTAASVTSTGADANATVTTEAGSGGVSGQESTTTPVTSAGTDANAVVTTEAGSGGVSGDASTVTPATSTGTDANGVVTVEAGSGAVSGEESTAVPVTSTDADANAKAGSGADHAFGGAWADKIWFGHNLNKSSDADHHSNFDEFDFDGSSGWTGVRDGAVVHGANALDGDGHSVFDAVFEGHNGDHGHTPAASDWLF